MKTCCFPGRLRGAGCAGLTLVELMVAVSVLSLIVLVLFRMFDQTQKALRANVAQVDVMEGGRAIMDLLRRDLEEAVARGGTTNNVNFFVGLKSSYRLKLPGVVPGTGEPVYATNELDEIYFLKPNQSTELNLVWEAVVYRVLSRSIVLPVDLDNPRYLTNYSREGVGWLARRTLTIPTVPPADTLSPNSILLDSNFRLDARHAFRRARGETPLDWSKFSRVADGVIHFKVTPLDSRGQPLHFDIFYPGPGLNWNAYGPEVEVAANALLGDLALDYRFLGSAVPASLQVELGVLEPQVVDRLRSLPNADAQRAFLEEQAAKIHYFQQRISLPSAPKLLPK